MTILSLQILGKKEPRKSGRSINCPSADPIDGAGGGTGGGGGGGGGAGAGGEPAREHDRNLSSKAKSSM